MRSFLLLGIVVFSVQVKAAGTIGSDLLVCTQSSTSSKGQCRLETLPLANKQEYEMDFTVVYDFPCMGPATDFQLTAGDKEDAKKPFPFTTAVSGSLTVTGFGPVEVSDANGARTGRRTFAKTCAFVVKSITQKPSSGTIGDWQKELNSLRTLLTSYQDNRDAWGALAVLEPAFGVYDKFVKNVLNDKVTNNELVEAVQGLLSCSDGTTDEFCSTLMDKLVENYRAAEVTEQEAAKLRKLQKALGSQDLSGVLTCKEGDTGCTPLNFFLNKYITADDRALLATARQKLEVTKGSQTKYESYEKSVKDTEDQIATLKATAGGYVQ